MELSNKTDPNTNQLNQNKSENSNSTPFQSQQIKVGEILDTNTRKENTIPIKSAGSVEETREQLLEKIEQATEILNKYKTDLSTEKEKSKKFEFELEHRKKELADLESQNIKFSEELNKSIQNKGEVDTKLEEAEKKKKELNSEIENITGLSKSLSKKLEDAEMMETGLKLSMKQKEEDTAKKESELQAQVGDFQNKLGKTKKSKNILVALALSMVAFIASETVFFMNQTNKLNQTLSQFSKINKELSVKSKIQSQGNSVRSDINSEVKTSKTDRGQELAEDKEPIDLMEEQIGKLRLKIKCRDRLKVFNKCVSSFDASNTKGFGQDLLYKKRYGYFEAARLASEGKINKALKVYGETANLK